MLWGGGDWHNKDCHQMDVWKKTNTTQHDIKTCETASKPPQSATQATDQKNCPQCLLLPFALADMMWITQVRFHNSTWKHRLVTAQVNDKWYLPNVNRTAHLCFGSGFILLYPANKPHLTWTTPTPASQQHNLQSMHNLTQPAHWQEADSNQLSVQCFSYDWTWLIGHALLPHQYQSRHGWPSTKMVAMETVTNWQWRSSKIALAVKSSQYEHSISSVCNM